MFCIQTPFTFGVIRTCICEMFVYKHTETTESLKNKPTF